MTHELVQIVEEVERSLFISQSNFHIPLNNFNDSEEQLLAEFLRQERDERSHYQRYEQWPTLVGKPLKYSSPKKYIRKRGEESFKLLELVNNSSDKLFKIGVSQVTVDELSSFRSTIPRFYILEIRLWEIIMAHAKQIAQQKGKDLLEIVRSQQMRDEIYKSIFPTKESFEQYYTAFIRFGMVTTETLYDAYFAVYKRAPTWLIAIVEKIPFVNKRLSEIPPRAITQNFLRDEMNYFKTRANRIYGV